MAGAEGNRPWRLERFLDALILELDKAQDTLAMKGINRKLTYTVRDVALDMSIFPSYDGDEVKFVTASPGESGASRISLQLGSITDRQIRDNAGEPVRRDSVSIEEIEDLDHRTRESLKSIGVRSVDDLERMERLEVNVENELRRKAGREAATDYNRLASMIQQARRSRQAPGVSAVTLTDREDGDRELRLRGQNLVLAKEHPELPAAELEGERLQVVDATPSELRLRVPAVALRAGGSHPLRVALDPHTLIQLTIKA